MVAEDWEPYYCAEPYTDEACDALRQGSGNPAGLLMARPVYSMATRDNRVNSERRAQRWVCQYTTCRAGVYQTITTTPGATCEVGAYVQSFSTHNTGQSTSELATAEDRDNSTWFIRVDLSGGTDAFASGGASEISRGYGYLDNIYDQYQLVSYTFEATSTQTTVFFENLRLWPMARNHSYIDDAYVRCSE